MSQGDQVAPANHSHQQIPSEQQLEAATTVFALLADSTRLQLLWLLSQDDEVDVSELAAASGAARPAVSQHLAKLRLAGLVQARRQGRRAVYSLRDGHLRRLVAEALNHADHQITGEPWHS